MTLNDVPLNDSESQTVFWVNMTDMASSMSSLNVQRGVGTSTNGSASFGASINMQTDPLYLPLRGGELPPSEGTRVGISFNGGMYNTFREMVNAHIVLPNQWRANARFSKVNSDGFLYRTASDLYSYYGDLGWYGTRTQVVARFFGGSEKTGMGWDGVDYNTAYGIDGADRRYNPAGEYTTTAADGSDSTAYYPNQTDNYAQQHAQLTLVHRLSTDGISLLLPTTPMAQATMSSINVRNCRIGDYWAMGNWVLVMGNWVLARIGKPMVCTANTWTTTSLVAYCPPNMCPRGLTCS
jgi:iron complex outermembrane receptor protein